MDLLFYFSGTGNSYNVAKTLSPNLIDIATVKNGDFSASSIGFVFPVYCNFPPNIVIDFIKNSTFNSSYIWAVATYGGGAGASLNTVHKLLKNGLSYANGITLPDNCIIFTTSKSEEERLLAREQEIVAKIKSDIDNRVIKIPKTKPISHAIGKMSWFAIKNIYRAKNPRSNENCTECGLCVRLCPTQNISAVDNGVVFGDSCEYCFGCIHFCPVNAIEFGKIKRADDASYHHPNVSENDLISGREP